ncbi:hypothetical protein ITP53_39350 [Nonomuraea sp. K274]|uniref:Uncharacterized protein n=1 Tax=Nonomuraea cypriaca TaxID=1187855 RepID=A0A931AK44_9ACTN|nr:hypothetical protein [Nonomuraea cypriaca]MBF8191650.1 hypothetical protein [Nonomuraea cypriaca]
MAGTAQPRSVTVTPIGDIDQVDAPDGVQPGDILLALVSSTGDVDDITISGGAPWVALAENTSQFSTRMYAQVAGVANPTSYAVELGEGDSGLVGLAHLRGATLTEIVIESNAGGVPPGTGIPCPSAEPGVAGGTEIRYALVDHFTTIEFFPFGYREEDQGGEEGAGRSAIIAARTSLSSTGLPVRRINADPSEFLGGWQAWTVIVSPGDYVPPPPPLPAFAVKGRALYRYTAHDLLTGTYIDDIYPRDVEYGKKLREPGPFSGSLPIPNRRVAAAVRRVIPKVKSDLTTGPGRVEIRIWRDGELRGRYWLTGARLNRGRDGKISIELRGSTLDAYWFSLNVNETLDGSDDEQISAARTFLSFALDKPGADIPGIQFQGGSSGVFRPFLVRPEDNTSYGRAVQEYSRSENGFEYFLAETVDETGVVSTWRWASPKFDTGVAHVFSTSTHGGDVAEYGVDIDALRGGTDWRARGGTLQPNAEEDGFTVYSDPVVTPHRAAGWARTDHIVDHPNQSTDEDELNGLAEYYAEIGGGALWVRTVTVILSKRSTLTMNSLGDRARLLITDVWHEAEDGGAGLDISERILEIRVRPSGRGRGREEATLTLESVEVP